MPNLRRFEYILERDIVVDTGLTGSLLVNDGFRGAMVFLNVEALSGSTGTAESLTVTIQGLSPVGTNEFYTILTSAVITATGLVVLRIYPGLLAAANLTVNDTLPPTWRINVATPSDGDQAYDYDVGYAYIP